MRDTNYSGVFTNLYQSTLGAGNSVSAFLNSNQTIINVALAAATFVMPMFLGASFANTALTFTAMNAVCLGDLALSDYLTKKHLPLNSHSYDEHTTMSMKSVATGITFSSLALGSIAAASLYIIPAENCLSAVLKIGLNSLCFIPTLLLAKQSSTAVYGYLSPTNTNTIEVGFLNQIPQVNLQNLNFAAPFKTATTAIIRTAAFTAAASANR